MLDQKKFEPLIGVWPQNFNFLAANFVMNEIFNGTWNYVVGAAACVPKGFWTSGSEVSNKAEVYV